MIIDPLFAVTGAPGYWPFLVLIIGIIFVIVTIAVLRLHAFVSLMLAAILVGFLARTLPEGGDKNHFVHAIDLSMDEFGNTAGKIAWVIALASIIGTCLMESGAADKIVRYMVRLLGEKRAGWALLISGFFLGIPVFFDTVFFLLIPLAQALGLRLGKHYVFYVAAIAGGAAITHSLVPPTPGPLAMAESLRLNLGTAILIGTAAGILPAVAVLAMGRILDARLNLPVRPAPGVSMSELQAIASKSESDLPPFFVSILPVALPVFLIGLAACLGVLGGSERFGAFYFWVELIGNKYLAMFLGTAIALGLLAKVKRLNLQQLSEVVSPPLLTAGVIILITAAGGAFGSMIKHSGVGAAIDHACQGSGISLIFLAWLISSIMKIAQGSGTVAMITTAGMMAAIVGDGASLAYHPIYLYLAIGFGSMTLSWMNDSGFWVVCKLSGFTEKETLGSWTILLATISIVGLIEVMIASRLLPLRF